jgi:hypothetical protein
MLQALHVQPEFSEKFLAFLLARNVELEEDLCDQLFNHSEKRLARVLIRQLLDSELDSGFRPPLIEDRIVTQFGFTSKTCDAVGSSFQTANVLSVIQLKTGWTRCVAVSSADYSRNARK